MASLAQVEKSFGQTQNALSRLKEAISCNEAAELKEDAVIKRFEFTYELLWKCFKKIAQIEKIECFSPKSSFQAAFKMGLLSNEFIFLDMIDARNRTTHVYSRDESHQIYLQILEPFVSAINEALGSIEQWIDKNK